MFGCGEAESEASLAFAPEATRAAYAPRSDRLRHDQRLQRDVLDWLYDLRLGARSLILAGVGMVGVLAPVLASMHGSDAPRREERIGRLHVLPSTPETVRLGVFDAALPDVLEIDSGDVVVYPDTWSHFLNRLQPGVPIDDLARLRRENPGRGPHSIVGPVGVRGARPGDMLSIEFQRLLPASWGATFVNPGDLGTGTLPEQFPHGQVRYLDFDLVHMRAEFLPGISVPLRPFQGTVGVAPAQAEPGSVSSVPPGRHAGNIDLRDLTEGTRLYIPVWQPGARLFTGDSHAAQGHGEVNNQALESAMREVRLRVSLHDQPGWAWPMAETETDWICMGIDADLNQAFRIATANVIEFLHRRAGLSPMDAYSLASIAVSFHVTQFVNQTRGVHASIPKALFDAGLCRDITVV
ncbi:MAG: acetamidase/formamidase family protein [Chloroflexi bacterium]|nr:acetamidase/formamidase family protein [Chloroflexota bacterium]